MSRNKAPSLLILDLDDTIFATSTFNDSLFTEAIAVIKEFSESNFCTSALEDILIDLKTYSFDKVAQKHSFPKEVSEDFVKAINEINQDLNISPYSDYPALTEIKIPKVLVTSGFYKFQHSKIESLGIQEHFEEIYIDDPIQSNRIYKKGIFKRIINDRDLDPSEIWVIGDNPSSELEAGYALRMFTVQRLNRFPKASFVDFAIDNFNQLKDLL